MILRVATAHLCHYIIYLYEKTFICRPVQNAWHKRSKETFIFLKYKNINFKQSNSLRKINITLLTSKHGYQQELSTYETGRTNCKKFDNLLK